MTYPTPSDTESPKLVGVYDFARSVTLYGTPTVLALLGLFLVLLAFNRGLSAGFRSLAGFALPVVIASFLYAFNRDLLRRLGAVSTMTGFLTGFAFGILLMLVLELTPRSTSIPLAELAASACFSVLVFASASSAGMKPFTYYYGTLSGLLLYVIVWGFTLAT